MQAEMANEGHMMPIHVAGVNAPGNEASNDAFTVGLGLPWLQDTAVEMVGASWSAEHFDLVILDPTNVEVAVYSLIEYDLSDPANYEEIKRALAAVADRRGTAGMPGDAQRGTGVLHGDMDSGAGGMHDDVPHGVPVEHQGVHAGMGDHADGMHDDMPGSCPDNRADMPMQGSHGP